MTKIALLIGVSDYGSGFKSLPRAQKDVQAMQQILQHPEIGSFDLVKTLLNPEPPVITEAIETVFSDRQSDDLVLLYFRGHSIQDDSGKLYLGTSITRKSAQEKLIKSSAVLASFVQEIMRCQSLHQVVILDCCFSTTLTASSSDKYGSAVDIWNQLGGKGRVILTSSTSTQCGFEFNPLDSVYTRYLVEGLETGAADLDNDGAIAISELHAYTSRKVQTVIPAMQPGIFGVEVARTSVLASSALDDPQLKYRMEVERCTQDGEISIVSRSILDVLRETLGLLAQEAAAIEAEVLAPYREYQQKLQRYVQECVSVIHHKPFTNNETRAHFQHLQLSLGLRDEDVAPLEAEIQKQIKALQPSERVRASSPVAVIPTEELTQVKLLNIARAASENELAAPTIDELHREFFSTQTIEKISNSSLSNSVHPNLVSTNKNSRLLIGASIAAVLTLIAAMYGIGQRQESQRLETIKAFTKERNYEECITVAKTISESSSRYTDAQRLLKQCETGVNWQNVQVKNLRGHSGVVWSVALSPDGQTLASGSGDNTIKLWNLSSGEVLRTFSEYDIVWSVAFSTDGQTIASGSSDNTIKIWDLGSGKVLRTLSGHSGAVRTIAFSLDGRTLASGSSDNTIKIWNLGSGKVLRTLSGHSGTVRSIAFSPDGQTLASGSSDNTIKLWKLISGALLRTLTGHTNRVISIALSPDGQLLVSGSMDRTIKIWNLSSGKLLRTLSGSSDSVNSIAISPDGRTLASGIGDVTKIWNLNTLEPLHTLSSNSSDITSVSFGTNGKTLASGSQDKTIKIWLR